MTPQSTTIDLVMPFLATRASGRRHYVADGFVGCPRQGLDADVESCLRCRALESVAADRAYIVCEGVAPPPADVPLEVSLPAGG
jgi:hypothetical protein